MPQSVPTGWHIRSIECDGPIEANQALSTISWIVWRRVRAGLRLERKEDDA